MSVEKPVKVLVTVLFSLQAAFLVLHIWFKKQVRARDCAECNNMAATRTIYNKPIFTKYSDNFVYVYSTIQSIREFDEIAETHSIKGNVFFNVSVPAPAHFYPGNYSFLTLNRIPGLLSDI
jgi:hypothetical protein